MKRTLLFTAGCLLAAACFAIEAQSPTPSLILHPRAPKSCAPSACAVPVEGDRRMAEAGMWRNVALDRSR